MTLSGAAALDAYMKRHPETRASLDRWRRIMTCTMFRSTIDLRRTFPKSYDYVPPRCHVFDIAHGRHRLVAYIDFSAQLVKVGTLMDHGTYNNWRCA